ncbi:MAG: DUF5667 domain-containing protein [Candidatus Parcubacteria bacterium]|nr:DUF5667 domain-containing protein [Candidatus Parcubacteria bacterium]
MKKSIITISFLILVILFALPVSASAKTKAGIKPGSFFYIFDTAFEKIGLFFTFSPEKKAQKAMEYAEEKLAEAEAMASENKPEAVATAMTNYQDDVSLATNESKTIEDKTKAENLLASIADNTSKHQEVLTEVLNKVPDEAKEAITKAIEASRKGQEEAMKQIAELKGEVEQLKKEVAELKTQDEEQKKIIEEVGKQKTETSSKSTPTAASTKPTTSQVSETTATPKPATTPSQTQTQTNEPQNTQPVVQPQSNTTNTTLTPTTQTQTTTTIEISSVNITPSLTSAQIQWQTNIPTNSKIFLSGGSLSSKIYNSESGLSTRHIVNATGLTSGTTYSYEIESIAGGQVAKKQDSFTTKPDEYTISIQPEQTSVPASGWSWVTIRVSTLKNGQQYQENQKVFMATPDSSQNKTQSTNASWGFSFQYLPKTVGIHTLTFSWNGVSKSIDIQVTEYMKIDPKIGEIRMNNPVIRLKSDQRDWANNWVGIGIFQVIQGDEVATFEPGNFKYESDIPLTFTIDRMGGHFFLGRINEDFKNGVHSEDYQLQINPQFYDGTSVQALPAGNHLLKITEMKLRGKSSGNLRTVFGLPAIFNFTIQ